MNTKPEFKTAQMRVKLGPRGKTVISAYGGSGSIFWETPTRAKFLIDSGGFELVNAVGPAEQSVAGPSETKPAGPLEKKSSAAVPDGHSTDSAPSKESGKAAASSVSGEVLRSPERIARPYKPRGKQGKRGRSR